MQRAGRARVAYFVPQLVVHRVVHLAGPTPAPAVFPLRHSVVARSERVDQVDPQRQARAPLARALVDRVVALHRVVQASPAQVVESQAAAQVAVVQVAAVAQVVAVVQVVAVARAAQVEANVAPPRKSRAPVVVKILTRCCRRLSLGTRPATHLSQKASSSSSAVRLRKNLRQN